MTAQFSLTNEIVVGKFPLLEKGQVYQVIESDLYRLVLCKLEEVKVLDLRQLTLANGIILDFAKHVATKDDVRLILTKTNWKILECLANANGATISIENLCKEAWNNNYEVDEPQYLRVQISRMRAVLGYDAIETIVGYGYRLCIKKNSN